MSVYSWGRGEDGQLGLGDTNDQHQPLLVEALQDFKLLQIACGSGHTVVLTEDREVHTWGRGDDGRLGHGDNGWKYVPRIVDALSGKSIRQVRERVEIIGRIEELKVNPMFRLRLKRQYRYTCCLRPVLILNTRPPTH